MKKINKFHVLTLYIVFSIALFWALWWMMGYIIEVNSSDPLDAFSKALEFLPLFLASYTGALCILSLTGTFVYKRNNKLEVYRGFMYSHVYSLFLLVVVTGFILYWY